MIFQNVLKKNNFLLFQKNDLQVQILLFFFAIDISRWIVK